jgi:Trypsin-co-occurring domain 1
MHLWQSILLNEKRLTGRAVLKRFVEFQLLDDGTTIVVEVDVPEEEEGVRRAASGTEQKPERAPQTFEQALSKIRPATEKVIMTLRDLIQQPDEIEMEFGFSLNAEAGVIVASASTKANYKVTLHWNSQVEKKQAEPSAREK